MNEFVRILNLVCEDIARYHNRDKLDAAINAWCRYLPCQFFQGMSKGKVNQDIKYHYNEWESQWESQWPFPNLLKTTFIQRLTPMKFIVLTAFVIVAVGFVIYLLNQEKQQPQQRSDRGDDSPPPPARRSTPTPSRPPVATVTKECLILVIDAAHGDVVESIRSKGRIEPEDCTLLYEATKCLSMKPENGVTQFSQVINQDRVPPGEELSEFDVYLVKIELRQPDAGLGGNVDNQLDRQDAFNRLPQLAANIQVSERLRMEAAERFDVYYR
jgi:hypothetical protein